MSILEEICSDINKHKMKTILLIFISSLAVAQNGKSGVYITFNDYLSNKLTYEINCKTDKETFSLNEFLNENHITVIHNKQRVKLCKDSIYGFVSCNDPLVRFQEKTHFYLAEKGKLWIFYKIVDAFPKKEYKPENPYHYYTAKEYYYSLVGDGKLIALTIENLKLSFSNSPKINSNLDIKFKNENIADYDSIHKVFKVNYFLENSAK